MKKYVYLCLLSILIAACNSPKSLYKKGIKLQEQNLHEQACLYFTQSLDKKPEFIEANLALKTSGQRVVNHYLDEFLNPKTFKKLKKLCTYIAQLYFFKKK